MKMRTIQKAFWSILIALTLVSINSCDTEIAELIPSMKATVNGEEWNSVFRLSTVTDSTIVVMGTPTASETADKTIILTTFGATEGTYSLNLGSLTSECTVIYKKTANATDGGDDYYVAYEANIVISKLDTENQKISGTFNAKLRSTGSATDEVIITDGSFENLLYQ